MRLTRPAKLVELVTGELVSFEEGADFNFDFYSPSRNKQIVIARSGNGGVFELTNDEIKALFT